ncbi:hypothetical protein ACFV4N_40030, partial [Actinosynnema sp. NPDC059797]
ARTLYRVLAWTVVFAVAGMHHLSPQESAHSTGIAACCDHSASENRHPPSPPQQHDVLHLCLAVLIAALALGLALLAVCRRAPTKPSGSPLGRGARTRAPPPRGAPAVLASLCVLRL